MFKELPVKDRLFSVDNSYTSYMKYHIKLRSERYWKKVESMMLFIYKYRIQDRIRKKFNK